MYSLGQVVLGMPWDRYFLCMPWDRYFLGMPWDRYFLGMLDASYAMVLTI